MKQKYQSELLGVIYEDALADFRVGAISEERMKHYEHECLIPEVPRNPFSVSDISDRRPSPVAASSSHK